MTAGKILAVLTILGIFVMIGLNINEANKQKIIPPFLDKCYDKHNSEIIGTSCLNEGISQKKIDDTNKVNIIFNIQ